MTFLAFCWRCGVNFRTDNVAADSCPECREKLNRTLAAQLKQAPVFRAIADRVAAILRREMQETDKTASATQPLTSEEYRQDRRDELVRRLFQMTALNEASIRRIVDLVEELYA